MKTLISVIIPTYNRAKILSKTINSILTNNINNYEIIIVDDGSNDDTESIVNNFKNEKIKYFKINNSERGAARNFGVKKSRGIFLNFFDSDDIAYSNHIDTATKVIKKNETIKIFHLSYDFISKNKKKNKTIIHTGNTNYKILRGNFISCNSLFINKSLFNEFKFDENRNLSGSEDWDLWLRLSRNYEIHNFKEVTSAIIDHDARSMNEKDLNKIIKRLQIIREKVNSNIYKNLNNLEMNKILAHLISYEALYQSLLASSKLIVIRNYIKSVLMDPIIIINLRSILILKNIIFKW
tara:strand:- start:8 stop:892 length:885 start_codon:yes stop_codon:yes gene_type:complete